jgi:glycerol-3-phosphate acyltransferase PlsY
MTRLPATFLVQALAVPAIVGGVAAALLTMQDSPAAAQYLVVLALSYLLASLSWGYMLLRWRMGLDVREYGSRSTGMSNVLRTGGGKAAGAVSVLDVGKGVLAVVLAREIIGSATAEVAASLVALVGHNWSVFLRFQGGRGVLTALGGLSMMTPVPAVVATATFLATAFLSRYISLGSIIGVLAGGFCLIGLALAGWYSNTYMSFAVAAGSMIIWQHRGNIQRIRDGKERRLGQAATRDE